MLRPHVAFAANDLAFMAHGLLRHRNKAVRFLQIVDQRVVEVTMAGGDTTASVPKWVASTAPSMPRQDCTMAPSGSHLQDFIPSHDATAFSGKVGADFIDEVGLKLGFGLEAQFRHFGLARAIPPSAPWALHLHRCG